MSGIDVVALQVELTTDPEALGYAPHVSAGDHSALVALLNAERGTAQPIWRGAVPSDSIRTRVTQADYTTLSSAAKNYLAFVLGGDTVDFSVPELRADLSAMFPSGTSRAAIISVIQAQPTRGEELFGHGARVSLTDVAAALR